MAKSGGDGILLIAMAAAAYFLLGGRGAGAGGTGGGGGNGSLDGGDSVGYYPTQTEAAAATGGELVADTYTTTRILRGVFGPDDGPVI